jgi:hypothetical protein
MPCLSAVGISGIHAGEDVKERISTAQGENMATSTKAPARHKLDNDAWDTLALGASLDHARNSGEGASKSLDEALGLQSISIRLPKQLIEQYKITANHRKVGYQPLMRDILGRFVSQAPKE